MTVVEKVPEASVVPVVVPKVTLPLPDWAKLITWPDNDVPAEFFATIVSVAELPPTDKELLVVVKVSVEPVMRMGIDAVLPLAVATIVAVRVDAFAPAPNVTVALPVESLVAVAALRMPESTENVTATPETAALDASVTVAVMVVVLLLSEATAVSEALRLIAAAVGTGVTGVTGVVVELPDPPPPQALRSANKAIKKKEEVARNVMFFNLCSCTEEMTNRVDRAAGRVVSSLEIRTIIRVKLSVCRA